MYINYHVHMTISMVKYNTYRRQVVTKLSTGEHISFRIGREEKDLNPLHSEKIGKLEMYEFQDVSLELLRRSSECVHFVSFLLDNAYQHSIDALIIYVPRGNKLQGGLYVLVHK